MQELEVQKILGDEYTPIRNENDAELVRLEKEGDTFEGQLVEITTGNYGNDYTFRDKDGNIKKLFGSTVINNQIEKVEVGANLKIVFLGERKSQTGRMYKDYVVGVKKE